MPSFSAFPLLIALGRLLSSVTVCQGGTLETIDDADPRIQYHGEWIPNTGNDPQMLNFGGTLTFSNTSGSSATLTFTGLAVAVYGAFGPGTFDIRSEYTLDGGTPTQFSPAGTYTQWLYRRPFFLSGDIPNGEHTLVVTNLGNQFWLDCIRVAVDPSSTTMIQQTSFGLSLSASPQSNDGQGSTSIALSSTQQPPPTKTTMTTSSGRTSEGSNIPLAPSSSNSSPPQTDDGTTIDRSPSTAVTWPPSATSSGDSPKSLGKAPGSPTTSPGAIVGVAIAGVILLVAVAAAAWWWRRRRRRMEANMIDPFAAEEPPSSPSKGANYIMGQGAHSSHNDPVSSISTSAESEPVPPVHSHGRESDHESSNTYTSSRRSESRGIERREKESTIPGTERPLGSRISHDPEPSSPWDLERHARVPSLRPDGVTPLSPRPVGRRSTDGGVRLAGGPPPSRDSPDEEVGSVAATLPPMYQLYPS